MRVAVIGVGGAGGYFGGMLSAAGHSVAMIARGAHLAAIRDHGLRITRMTGDDVVIQPALATDDSRDVGPVDVVLLGVKARQVRDAALAARPMIASHTAVVPLQNGIEAPDHVAGELGASHVIGATTRIISAIAAPGHIRHIGAVPTLELGELDGSHSERVVALSSALDSIPGVSATASPNIRAAIWTKFLFTCSWSGVGAAARAPVGVIRELPQTRRLLEQAMTEIERVASASGVPLAEGTVSRTLAYLDTMPPQGTTSMQRDLDESRPSELDSLNGAVVRAGQRAGVPTPLHEFLYDVLLPRELQARAQVGS